MPVLRSATTTLALLLALAVTGCAGSGDEARTRAAAATAGVRLVDDFGDTLGVQPHGEGAIPVDAQRIVSLNPTTTELLFALRLGDRLVGRSRWDAWPAEAARVPSVGDGIRPNVEAILAAHPSLVVLYASADNRPAARALRAAGVATLAVRVDSIAEFRRVTRLLATVLGAPERGEAVVDSVDATLARVRRLTAGVAHPTVLWRAWDVPLMVIGGGSYFTELVEIAGGRNAFADDPRPSPQVSFEEVLRRNPDRVLAGDSAAAAAMRQDARWRTLPAVAEGRLLVVDGDLLARPSVRLGEAAVHLASRLHPELAASLQQAPAAR
jgi:iron complex transport system substrate-binding protein